MLLKPLNEKELTAAGHTVRLVRFCGTETGLDKDPLVLCYLMPGEWETLREACRALDCPSFYLAAAETLDWRAELSPWPDGEDFRGLGEGFYQLLMNVMLPSVFREMAADPLIIINAGYSLAGLFALWSLYRTPLFDGVICASGSLWYPGFDAYMRGETVPPDLCAAYFSIGDRECRTRHPLMSRNETLMAEAASIMTAAEVTTVFEKNKGGHFDDPAGRLAKGIRWMLTEGFLF